VADTVCTGVQKNLRRARYSSSTISRTGVRCTTSTSRTEASTSSRLEMGKRRSRRPCYIGRMSFRSTSECPGMSGTEAMHVLPADPSFVDTPIVALTAHALDGERRLALDAGFDELIAKPCLPDALPNPRSTCQAADTYCRVGSFSDMFTGTSLGLLRGRSTVKTHPLPTLRA